MEMYKKISPKSAVSLIFAIFVIFLIVSCAMVDYPLSKGRVVEGFNSVVYVDIQREDAVSVGQELNVYKVIRDVPEPSGIPTFKGVQTGKVKITEIFNNGIAKAVVISGQAEKGDIVELAHPN